MPVNRGVQAEKRGEKFSGKTASFIKSMRKLIRFPLPYKGESVSATNTPCSRCDTLVATRRRPCVSNFNPVCGSLIS